MHYNHIQLSPDDSPNDALNVVVVPSHRSWRRYGISGAITVAVFGLSLLLIDFVGLPLAFVARSHVTIPATGEILPSILAARSHVLDTISTAAVVGPAYDTKWQSIVSGSVCTDTQLVSKRGDVGTLACGQREGRRHFKFPVGTFDIDQQVVVPINTTIEGHANPNNAKDMTERPDPSTQTFFVATHGVHDHHANYCGTHHNLKQGDAQRLRVGFLLNSHTVVRNINFQGRDTIRPHDNSNLCGGGVFETPGCVSPGFGDGKGYHWKSRRTGCYDHAGHPNDLVLGDGNGAHDVVIENVRLNDLFLPEHATTHQYMSGQASQLAVWTPMTKDGSAVRNLRITNLVSMLTRGDGINLHGNVQNSVVEGCHIENTGDDIYAVWGAYAENPADIVFRNNVGKNPGVTRNYWYGVCIAIYGVRSVSFTGTRCTDIPAWKWSHRPQSNGAMAIVHDGWFGAIYPPGAVIKIPTDCKAFPTECNRWNTGSAHDPRPQVRDEAAHADVQYSPR